VAATRKERKVVTVLFAGLVGFTARAEALDPEDVEAILQPYHAQLRAELERFGGTVEEFVADAVMARSERRSRTRTTPSGRRALHSRSATAARSDA
jgi:class 3 adenylate cyclase